jgi:hypothetical protein
MRGIEAPSQCPSLHFPCRFGSYPTSAKAAAMSATGHSRRFSRTTVTSGLPRILLQKSKVAGLKIFRKNTKQRAVADSYDLNRVTEVACEFCVRL